MLRLSVDGAIDGFEQIDAAVLPRRGASELVELEGWDMMYSSGTTGRPKGVKRPLSGRRCGTYMPAIADSISEFFGMSERDRWLRPAPTYHSSPLTMAVLAHRMGAGVVVLEKFDAELALATIEKYRQGAEARTTLATN